ncbi:RDD family protein [Luteipulveratus sp. YIM 133132]|uniref:RDD family protein n=1 Tax=Luteipulveratus flavus TaxID=3031728 RepID=A0ABT6C4T6_9MICO|nr:MULTISPECIES: RDD family protein [unclassified Luteipulveratus]MDE9367078.1 RDD family protein [Luteipulveratus sp. YIM 133132]MDF8263064.1 RDD family protein [Luteipulveratus sp. YIM 133296]
MTEQIAPEHRALRGREREELVTGEAVLLEVPPASLPSRLGSGLLDVVINVLGFVVTFWVIATLALSTSSANMTTLALLDLVAWTVALPVALETLTRGRTIGKLVFKLRTVRDDGGPIVFRHALTRGLVGFVEVYLFSGVPAVLASMATSRARRLGDLAAGTYVVREATHIRLGAAPTMPPALDGWARRADIAALPDGLALGIRQFLQRAGTLSPAARQSVCQDLLDRTLPLVSPPPPAGAPAEAVLAAVLADRRRRDTERLVREDDVRRRLLPPDTI